MELQSRIDFHNLAKPGNLANSAVLRMLEEEERSGRQQGLKRVAWPPPPEESYEQESAEVQEPLYSQRPHQYQQQQFPQQSYQQQQFQKQEPQFHPQQQPFNQPENQYQQQPFSPVKPVAPPTPRQDHQPAGYTPQQHAVFHPVRFEPPRATVTLRPSPPLSQAPSPVYAAQPVAVSIKGGERMRGDQKWPPESVKQQSAAENEARLALAKGPACRPRKVKKDYSSFFAQHALNSTYPGYRPPPGTQHYSEGTSDL
ncbi:basic-leucine zipper transcription factor A isoform X2 [Cimex lectularius]|uniref:Uncharacterized protein n=1 Tax=Cimex lectularius TaxID=79782 RepID=A0A8I6TI25_CIMLE|nr:basic-leucine zipper transcription factor A isoform X2 [Cimex lectularius]